MSIKATVFTLKASALVAIADTIIASAGAVYRYLDDLAHNAEEDAHAAETIYIGAQIEKAKAKYDAQKVRLAAAHEAVRLATADVREADDLLYSWKQELVLHIGFDRDGRDFL